MRQQSPLNADLERALLKETVTLSAAPELDRPLIPSCMNADQQSYSQRVVSRPKPDALVSSRWSKFFLDAPAQIIRRWSLCVLTSPALQQYDPKKSSSKLDAAKAELSEEARLHKGTWVNLLSPSYSEDDETHPGIPELKWWASLVSLSFITQVNLTEYSALL